MKKIILPLLLLSLLAFITGCGTSYGNKAIKDVTHENLQQSIVIGETSREEILARFGTPTSTTYSEAGNIVLAYNRGEISTSGIEWVPIVGEIAVLTDNYELETKDKNLVFYLDDNGKVLKYMLNDTVVSHN